MFMTRTLPIPGRHLVRIALVILAALLIWLLPSAAVPHVSANTSPTLYVISPTNKTLSKGNLDGTGGAAVTLNPASVALTTPYGLALDPAHDKLYIANFLGTSGNHIFRCNLDGTGAEDLGTLGGLANQPIAVAVDPVNGKLYVSNLADNKVIRANLDGSSATVLTLVPTISIDVPGGLAVDELHGKLYITNSNGNTIVRANLDGSGAEDLGNLGNKLSNPIGIALDAPGNRMFVANTTSGKITQAALDGTGGTDLGTLAPGTLNHPTGIAIDVINEKMYVANGGNSTLSKADLSGANGSYIGTLNNNLSSPQAIVLYSPPDLSTNQSNAVGGGVPVGSSFTWTFGVSGLGALPAYFNDGEVILRDNLPPGPAYGTPTASGFVNVVNSANINCAIASSVLTCTASGKNVMLESGESGFEVSFSVTTNTPGTLTSPANAGVCRVDPDSVVTEIVDTNNDCSDRVDVNRVARGLKLYISNVGGYNITRANLDGTDPVSLGSLGFWQGGHRGLAIDSTNGKIYVALSSSNKVARANLDGSSPEDLGNPLDLLSTPMGVALDVAGNRMFVVSSSNSKIVQSTLNGTGGADLGNASGLLQNPYGLALDVPGDRMYIASWGNNRVVRAALNGTGAANLVDIGALLGKPSSIALDVPNGKMYITMWQSNKIVRANLDGTGATDLGNPGGLLSQPNGIALDLAHGKMYISSSGNNKIIIANLDGSGVLDLGNMGGAVFVPGGIALDLSPLQLNLPLVVR